MTAIRENRLTIRNQICTILTRIELLDVFWTNSKCPECKDDHEYFFVIDKEFYKTDEKGYVSGGYICLNCGWSNAGGIHESDLPEGYDATYHKD